MKFAELRRQIVLLSLQHREAIVHSLSQELYITLGSWMVGLDTMLAHLALHCEQKDLQAMQHWC